MSRIGVGEYDGRKLDIDLAIDVDAELPMDPERDWEAFKTVIGRRIATLVADRVVPSIIGELGARRTSQPAFDIKSEHVMNGVAKIDEIGGTMVAMRQSMQGTFRLQAAGDDKMEGGDLIYAARDIIAAEVAYVAVFALEQRFEGKQTSDTKWAINRKDGQIVGFQRKEVSQTAPTSYQVH